VNEFWYQIKLRSFPRPVVVLDVSTASAGLWPVLASTVEGLAEAHSAAGQPDVAFLGSAERVPLADFLKSLDERFTANRGRGRVVGPLFDSFRGAWPARVVVIAARPVLDLADWASSQLARRLAVVRVDPTVPVAGGYLPENDLSDVESVARLVVVPLPAVRIRGGMPVGWDNLAYRFESGELVSDPGWGGDVRIGFLTPGEKPGVVAELVRPGLDADRLRAVPVDPPALPAWRPFTSAELTLLDAWRGGRAGYCSRCRSDHAPGVVICPDGGRAFPSLERVDPGSFVRVRVRLVEANFQPTPGPVLRIGEEAVVHRSGDGLAVWRYDPVVEEWRATGERWGPFERTGPGDEFALALPGGVQ
jgi:hypothetical protein